MVMALSDLDFSPGLSLQKEVQARFGTSISPTHLSPGFILVASFSRPAIRINEDSDGLILLQSCLGGQAANFRVGFLSSWCFRFEVSSKAVGFFIYGLKSFVFKSFAVHFALWGDGGPKWVSEFAIWSDQKDRDWSLVTPKRSYTSVVKNLSIGFHSRPSSVFQRLRYPVDYQKNFSEGVSDFAKHGMDDLRPSSIFHRLGPIPRNPRRLRQSTDPVRHADRVARVHCRSRYLNSKSERDLGGVSNLNEDDLRAKNIVHDAQSLRLNGHVISGRVQQNFSGSCYNCLGQRFKIRS
jgi:hypothetical protein